MYMCHLVYNVGAGNVLFSEWLVHASKQARITASKERQTTKEAAIEYDRYIRVQSKEIRDD